MPHRRLRTVLAVTGAAALLTAGATACSSDSGSGSDDSGPTRVVRTVKGDVKVPAEPKRVVTLDMGELDTALTLGVKPVGSVVVAAGSGLPAYLKDKTSGIKEVGQIAAPNLEMIEALDPDLILGNAVRDGDRYDELSKIAPTVLAENAGTDWQPNFLLDAEALGKSEEAHKVVSDFTARAKALGTSLGDPSQTKVSVLRFVSGENRLYGKGNFVGSVLSAVGLGRPAVQDTGEFMIPVSAERIEEADGDVVFVATYGPKEKTDHDKVTGGPLWKTLKAVQEGRVHEVPDEYWMVGTGYTAANLVLDDLERYLPKS